jgi:long-subunit fatty acid transport protein
MVLALTYQNLFDFNREAKFTLSQISEGPIATVSLDRNIDICHEGNLSAIGFSYGISLTPKLSFGFTLNFWEDWLGNHGWDETTRERSNGVLEFDGFIPPANFRTQLKEKKEFSFSGFNANFGFLWRITDNLTMGGVLKTPFTADLDIKTKSKILVQLEDGPAESEISKNKEDADLDMPLSYGIGFSYRFSDAFTVDADVYRTEWDDFRLKRTSGDISPITGLPEGKSDIDPTTQVRLGFEYLFIEPPYVIPLRGGVFYDPAPAEGSPDDIYGVSLGSGIAWKNIIFDIAYQFRWGNNVNSSLYRDFDFSSDLREHSVYSSLIFHF